MFSTAVQFLFYHMVVILAYKPDDNACNITTLEPAQLTSCTDEDNNPFSVWGETDVPSGSLCDIICPDKDASSWVTCIDGSWSDYHIKHCDESPVQSRYRAKRGWFRRAVRRIGRFFRRVGRFISCLFKNCKPPDRTKPSLVCPPNMREIASKGKTFRKVTWVEPTANDNKDGPIRPTRWGKGSGEDFSGTSTIGYYARDKSGNMATCKFTVTITVVRCPKLSYISNGYYHCNPSSDPIYGASCTFGCYRGYSRVGEQHLHCMITGAWSGIIPHCEKKTCPTLPPSLPSLQYTCSDGNRFRSICTYSCPSGYDITPGMSRVRVCTEHGTWRGIQPNCTDIEPPQMENCIHTVYAYADRKSTSGVAVWSEPTARDNNDGVISVVKEGLISPGDVLTAGSYSVTYKASDAAGNKAQSCTTNVIMKVLRCTNIYPTPFLDVTCPSGRKFGSECKFDCDFGSVLNGTDIAVCEKALNGKYAYWTWGDSQPFCSVIQKCASDPNVPANGALACDYWLGGKFCQMLCKHGYDVPYGKNFDDMLVCSDSGKWLPNNALPLPDCARSRYASRGIMRMSITYYFTGDCTDPSVVADIKAKFILTLNSSSFRDACLIYAKECIVDNVEVRCGVYGKKRSAELRVDFDVDVSLNSSSPDSFTDFRRNQDKVAQKVEESRSAGSLDFSVSTGGSMEAQDTQYTEVTLECPDQTFPSYQSGTCVECTAGTYYDTSVSSCLRCPRGKYQPLNGQEECLSCPSQQTTKLEGSKSVIDCTDGCEPGSWSSDGTPLCSLCPIGYYTSTFGASSCTECPGSRTSIEEGTSDISQCQEFDLRLPSSDSEIKTNFNGNFSDTFCMSVWIQRENSSNGYLSVSFLDKGANKTFGLDIGTDSKILNESSQLDIGFSLVDNRWHSFVMLYEKDKITIYIDNDVFNIDQVNFSIEKDMTLSISGEGTVSQLNVWSMNNNTLQAVRNLTKSCFNSKNGDIFAWKELENIDDDDTYRQIPSQCDDFNDCTSNPCINGDCVDNLGGYECVCPFGFYGDNCEVNIDDCIDNVCENNGTCIDGAANYSCKCKYGFKGELCEITMVDGSWGAWSEWSTCSLTCNNGTQYRTRQCDEPSPDNGGLDCPDNNTEYRSCNDEQCPVCSALNASDHMIMSCQNSTNSINCTIECAEGFDFDHEVKQFYFCGQETFFLWDFKTDDNPDGKMPYCSEIKNSTKQTVAYTASYRDLVCDSHVMYQDTRDKVRETVSLALNNINCVSSGVCFVNGIIITKCSQRSRRSTLNDTAGFEVTLTCDPSLHGSENCFNGLYTAVYDLESMAFNQTLDTTVLGTLYQVETSNTFASSVVNCPTGSVPVSFYCIECSPGRYYDNGECLKCNYGTYQDRSGQLRCKTCPEWTTTPGRESRSVEECSVVVPGSSDTNDNLIIVAGVMSAVLLAVVTAFTYLTARHYLR